MPLVDEESINNAYNKAMDCRDNIIFCTHNGSHVPKVCCICDQFIFDLENKFIDLKTLNSDHVRKHLDWKRIKWEDTNIEFASDSVLEKIMMQYTPSLIKATTTKRCRAIDSLILSKRSFGKIKNGKIQCLGCCKYCFKHVKELMKKGRTRKRTYTPRFAIANGLFHGFPPKELKELNSVELAFISLARINHHIFSFTAGEHKKIKGYHTLRQNDIQHATGVLNYFTSIGHASISVVLTGPFTPTQKAIVLKSMKLDVRKVKAAFKWLRENNVLYKNVSGNFETVLQPHITDMSYVVNSGDPIASASNIEHVYEVTAVFSDTNPPTQTDGGFDTESEFKTRTIRDLLGGKSTLLARSSGNILRDYEGDSLLKAFPLQFPFGIGSKKLNNDDNKGCEYYRYLSRLSSPAFQTAEFCLVIYNMARRERAFRNSCLRSSIKERQTIANLEEDDLKAASNDFLNGERTNSVAGVFLQKMRSISKTMPNTQESATRARTYLFQMIVTFGLPALMFTITPEDLFNYRIRIMVEGVHDNMTQSDHQVPAKCADDQELFEFVASCERNRKKYPGLCAIDFEIVLEITIMHLLGWDKEKQENISGIGLFGDLDAYAIAVEEQGRGTLHAHILIWIKGHNNLVESLQDKCYQSRMHAISELQDYASKIMTTELYNIYPQHDEKCNCGASLAGSKRFCTYQDLRELRVKNGSTSFGDTNIMQCTLCNSGFSAEDLLKKKLNSVLKINGIQPCQDSSDFFTYNQYWNKQSQYSKYQVAMEMEMLRSITNGVKLQGRKTNQRAPALSKFEYMQFLVSASKNLHCSRHTKSCHKYDKKGECRAKMPSKPSSKGNLLFDAVPTEWYTWKGQRHDRKLYIFEPKRQHEDCFVNRNNKYVSVLFQCNNNIIWGIGGGSICYCTLYAAKSTQADDKEMYTKAAQEVIKRLGQKRKKELEIQDITLNPLLQPSEQTENNSDLLHDDMEKQRKGLQALLYGLFLATRGIITSAPMASFLIRNHDRFLFSHSFSKLLLYCFENDSHFQDDICIDTIEDGEGEFKMFATSHISNYIHRPRTLANISLYDFTSEYTATKVKDKYSLDFDSGHISRNNIRVKKRKHKAIPTVSFLDFVDTRTFGGIPIDTMVPFKHNDPNHQARETYAKKALILFHPFSSLEDLKINDRFLPKFQDMIEKKQLQPFHEKILSNIQSTFNSMNAGRPQDPLERVTISPMKHKTDSADDNNMPSEALIETIIENYESLVPLEEEKIHRNNDGIFMMKTSVITKLGSNRCGEEFLKCPTVPTISSIWNEQSSCNDNQLQPLHTEGRPWSELLPMDMYELNMCSIDVITHQKHTNVLATGTLENMKLYASETFNGDVYQQTAFIYIVSAFVLKVHDKCIANSNIEPTRMNRKRSIDGELRRIQDHNQPGFDTTYNFCVHSVAGLGSRTTIIKLRRERKLLMDLHKKRRQTIMFLSGAGGTGKSRVIHAVKAYCKQFCENLNIAFNKRTLVVTALTGSAAISIRGETTHSACQLTVEKTNKTKSIPSSEEWRDTAMIIIDEVSFAQHDVIENISNNLNMLTDAPRSTSIFGGIQVVFAGDFSQLPPIGGTPLYTTIGSPYFRNGVHIMLELKTNHRFHSDPRWGEILSRIHSSGPNHNDIDFINSRVIIDDAIELPSDLTYAVARNSDRCAINDGIFLQHLKRTHSRSKAKPPPDHTICICGTDIAYRSGKKSTHYKDFPNATKDILFASCSDNHITSNGSRHIDPLLKLYIGCPVMITENIAVEKGIANGSMCSFRGITLKKTNSDESQSTPLVNTILIDGFYVKCVNAKNVEKVHLELLDDNDLEEESTSVTIENYNNTSFNEFRTEPITTKSGIKLFVIAYPKGFTKTSQNTDIHIHMTYPMQRGITIKCSTNTITKEGIFDIGSNSVFKFSNFGGTSQMLQTECNQNVTLKISITLRLHPIIIDMPLPQKPSYAKCMFPLFIQQNMNHNVNRERISIRITQFPLNISHARTVHKLQGRTIKNLFISSWSYAENWVYVVLSRCKSLSGLYIRTPLQQDRVNPMNQECETFYTDFRKRQPPLIM